MDLLPMLLLITDSQGRFLARSGRFDCAFRPGGKARHLFELLERRDLTQYDDIAIWLGGNDAFPRFGGVFNPSRFAANLHYAVQHVRAVNPQARIQLVSATYREQRGVRAVDVENLTVINNIIRDVALAEGALYGNPFRKLERLYEGRDYLQDDGIHLTLEARWAVVEHIRYVFSFGAVPKDSIRDPPKPLVVAGQQDILSMFWHAPLQYGNCTFRTAEHAYQHTKCKATGLYQEADWILSVPTPAEAKRRGRVANSRLTEGERLLYLKNILLVRWQQQPMFRLALLASGVRRIVHDVNDPFWGHNRGQGGNAYGKALMELRHFMR